MAFSKFTPPKPVATQVRQSVLGVKSGGSQGRSNAVLKGVGLNKSSGGSNVFGSLPKAQYSSTITAPISGPAPIKAPANDPYRSIIRNGKRVLVRMSQLTSAERNALSGATATKPNFTPAAPSQPAGGTAPGMSVGKPSGPIDYRALSSYITGNARLNFELGNGRADLNTQLDENKREYARQIDEAKRGYTRSVEDSINELNHAGLLRSGKRETMDADRVREFDQYLSDIEQNYGAGAAAKINQALARLDQEEALSKQELEAQAQSEYNTLYPAAPLDVTEQVAQPAATPTAPVAQAPVDAKPSPTITAPVAGPAPIRDNYANGLNPSMFTSEYLRVKDPKSGKMVAKKISGMSKSQVLAALALDVNKPAIGSGYYYDNGHLYKR